MLTSTDMAWWSDVVASAYSCRDLDAFASSVLPCLPARFGSVATSCDEFHLRSGTYRLLGLVSELPLPDHQPHLHENPNASSLIENPRSVAIQSRDTVSDEVWHRTGFYQYVARPMGWDDQLLISYYAGGWLGGVGLHRDVCFSADERFLMQLFCPHLQAIMCRLHPSGRNDAERQVLEVSVSPSIELETRSPIYEWLMGRYFPGEPRTRGVPDTLRRHVVSQIRSATGTPFAAPMKKLRIRSTRGELAIRCFPYQPGGKITLELAETRADIVRVSLTRREQEILTWLREGKRDAEIATILEISTKTVGKHVEHILAKTGTKNRTAAAMRD